MPDSVGPKAAPEANPKREQQPKPDDSSTTTWVVPIVTAVLLASAFCAYYFVYVGSRREYLVNRNFRSLAALGDQVQRILSTHASILEFYADLADPSRVETDKRRREDLSKFLLVRPEDRRLGAGDRRKESSKDYVRYLAPDLDLVEEAVPVRKDAGKQRPRLEEQLHDGKWQLILRALRHHGAKREYAGSLEIQDLLKLPAESMPFDDILLVAGDGTVVYQHRKAGPQFTTLASLLKARTGAPEKSGGEQAEESHSGPEVKTGDGESGKNAPGGKSKHAWRNGAIHLTDVQLAGTRSKLFLQPVLVDVFSDDPSLAEPAEEWVLCGLRTAAALEWEALSISYTFIIGFTALFFSICMGGPVLKVIFMNPRERFRLREIGFLCLFLVLLGSVFTLTALQFVDFRVNATDDRELRRVGNTLSENIHQDLKQMRKQLVTWCEDPELRKDLSAADKTETIRNTPGGESYGEMKVASKANDYPSASNAFWTDDDGQQVVKWSTSGYVTPMINISKLRAYREPKKIYLDGVDPPFYFDSILPPNKLEYLAALTIKTKDCGSSWHNSGVKGDLTDGLATLTSQPYSLVDPILPFGYGFALVDEDGLVLFHSDKTKDGRENFREESDWSKELYAGIFGHSTEQSMRINYLGKDYRAIVLPVRGVSQASWSLIVYSDLMAERTLALQTMTMSATLIMLILGVPALVALVWCLIHRPQFAPAWLWPDRWRTGTYWYQVSIYVLLTAVFLAVGFSGPIERIIIACAAVPYTALLLTIWGYRRYPSATEMWRKRRPQGSMAAPLGLTIGGAAAFLVLLVMHWSRLKALVLLPVAVAIAIIPLLDRPRRYVAAIIRQRRARAAAAKQIGRLDFSLNNVHIFALTLILLLVMLGVLMPMALYRGCLDVERRLSLKQKQLHLASAVTGRRIAIHERCEKEQIGVATCAALESRNGEVWNQILVSAPKGPNPSVTAESHQTAKAQDVSRTETYEDWFRSLIYQLHHDYNSAAAETLGIISDRAPVERKPGFPDWSWENTSTTLKLRWHGIHPPTTEETVGEDDLIVESNLPVPQWSDIGCEFGAAAVVVLVLGGLLWMLARKVFMVHLAPLKMTGVRELAEALRLGKNVLILTPPDSGFQIESPATTVDLSAIANEPRWAESVSLEELPLSGVIQIQHFEFAGENATPDQKLTFLLRLMKRDHAQIVVLAAVMQVPPSPEDYRREFPQLTGIDLREEPFLWLRQYEGPARDVIWAECAPISPLWPLGAQLARDIRNESIQSDDTIASEILERGDRYYRLVWRECSDEQKFVLSQLAEDGLLNPMNGRAIRQLIRRRLIVQDPQFRIMNESFRRFLGSMVTNDQKQRWLGESRRTGWGKIHGAFFTTMIVLGVFLLTTQNALWQSSAAYVTTAFGALGTLSKLFNTYRSGGLTREKAN